MPSQAKQKYYEIEIWVDPDLQAPGVDGDIVVKRHGRSGQQEMHLRAGRSRKDTPPNELKEVRAILNPIDPVFAALPDEDIKGIDKIYVVRFKESNCGYTIVNGQPVPKRC